MKNYVFLLFSILSFGCQMNKHNIAIDWKEGDSLPDIENQRHIGVAGPITGIIGNKLIIAGGANFPEKMPWDGGIKKYQQDVYLYDINSEGKIKYIGRQDFKDSLAYSANISIDDKLFSIGGEREGQATSDVIVYYLDNDLFIRQDVVYPNLPVPLTNGAVVHVDNTLYFAGGENADIVSNKIYALDLKTSNSTWKEFVELPKPLSHTVFLNDDNGNLYVIGGRKRNSNAKSDIYKEVYKIDIRTKEIQPLGELPEQLAAGTGLFYDDNILVFGGDNGSTFHQVEQLIADINLSSDEGYKKMLVDQKNKIQRAHPGFNKNVWVLNVKDNIWYPSTSIIGESPVTTTAILYNNRVIIPSGEIKAGVRTNQILVGQIQ